MAGYRLTVCLPGEARDRLEDAVAEAMEPFRTEGSRPYSADLWIWDDWVITGGADGYGYRIRPGQEEDPRIVHDHLLRDGVVRPSLPGWCAGGPRGLLVVGEARERAVRLAGITWDGWQELVREHPPGRPWADFCPEYVPGTDYGAYREACAPIFAAYLAQTPAEAFARWADGLSIAPGLEEFRSHFLGTADPRRWIGERTREEYVTTEARRADRPANLLTLDGWWWEEGDPPLHGACDDPATCHHTPPTADEYGTPGYLAGLPDDTLLVYLRCHV
ncbi:hypothetical protein ACFCV9_13595 [Streptomyces sp. NPDC056367]|uniref:hypothetical protein n=1 Tax=unclassified Streptomyces TaxID=2593676 RepID=UPI0035DEAF71